MDPRQLLFIKIGRPLRHLNLLDPAALLTDKVVVVLVGPVLTRKLHRLAVAPLGDFHQANFLKFLEVAVDRVVGDPGYMSRIKRSTIVMSR